MDPIRISLDDYIPAGGGFNGESYDHRSDPSVMLKLYFPGKIQQPLDEMIMARKVFDLGVPTPEPGEYVVTGDGRYGIRFRRIIGKKSYARAVGEDPQKTEAYAGEFAFLCRELHATHVDKTQFTNIKDRYNALLEENPFFTPAEKRNLRAFIEAAPDTDTALHGDLHFGNAIFTGNKRYFIDLGDFCYGCPLFDIGMVYLSCNISSEAFIRENFHMDGVTARAFWKAFATAYFGPDLPLKGIEKEVLPYAGLKTLNIERDSGRPEPVFRAALKSIL